VSVPDNFLSPLARIKEALANRKSDVVDALVQTTGTRLTLGRLSLSLGTVPSASAHELALSAALFFLQIWNQKARPDLLDHSPGPWACNWDIDIHPPRADMGSSDAATFLALVATCFEGFNPRSLDAELKLEYVKAKEKITAPPAVPAWAKAGAPIYVVGERAYSIGGSAPMIVTDREDTVLQSFIGNPAMDLPALANKSGLPAHSIPAIVGQLRKKYDGRFRTALSPPGRKGRGGYKATVVDIRT
jgi:hypothetical protein